LIEQQFVLHRVGLYTWQDIEMMPTQERIDIIKKLEKALEEERRNMPKF